MNPEKTFLETCKKIKLNKKEKILVALSGGKDSAVLAFLLKKYNYNIEGIYVDLCVGDYSKKCLEKIRELCKNLDVKLNVYDLKKEQKKSMFEIWKKNEKLNHCSACGVMKKWALNKIARKLKVSKIATGHNLDDEAQTFLINIFKGAPELSANTGAITKKTSEKKFIPRIKPLYYISEKEVLKFAKKNKIPFIEGKCPYAEESYRIEVRNFLEKISEKKKMNIIKKFESVKDKLRKETKIKNYCEICGEPSRKKVCKKCKLVK